MTTRSCPFPTPDEAAARSGPPEFHSPPCPVAAGAFFSSRISMAISGKALAIDFFAISDAKDQNYQTIVFDLADEPVVAHAIFPELPKP